MMMEDQLEGRSEYEVARARNIERNNAKLRTLGLISVAEEEASNAAAWSTSKTGTGNGPSSKHSKRNKRKKDEPASSSSPSRKSLRLKGLEPDGCTAVVVKKRRKSPEKPERDRRAARQRAALEHSSLGAARAARENPTATYEHCLMRVRTMSEKQLRNRVRTIERAAGKHCVVKMAIMVSCLRDEGMWALAEVANAALERLKGLQPPPGV